MHEFLLSIISYLLHKDMFFKNLIRSVGWILGGGEGSHGKDIYRFAVSDPCTDPCGERIGVP